MKIRTLSLILIPLLLAGCKNNGGKTTYSLAVEHNPTKTEYTAGEYFDPEGLTLAYTVGDSTTYAVYGATPASEFSFMPSLDTALETWMTSVIVTFKGLSCPIDITVNEASHVEYTIDFSAYIFEGDGVEMSTTTPNFAENTEIFFNNSFGLDIVEELTYEPYVGFRKYEFENTGLDSISVFQLSSGSAEGELSITFSKKLVSISLTAQAYYKAFWKTYDLDGGDPYTVYSYDADTTFLVNNQSWALPYSTLEQPIPEKETKEFTINSYTLTLSDDDYLGRVFLYNATFTFEE